MYRHGHVTSRHHYAECAIAIADNIDRVIIGSHSSNITHTIAIFRYWGYHYSLTSIRIEVTVFYLHMTREGDRTRICRIVNQIDLVLTVWYKCDINGHRGFGHDK